MNQLKMLNNQHNNETSQANPSTKFKAVTHGTSRIYSVKSRRSISVAEAGKRKFVHFFISRIVFLFIFLISVFFFPVNFSSASPQNEQKICYWEAVKNGKKSILFGTMHILPGSYLRNLRKKIISSDVIIVEINDFSEALNKISVAGQFKGNKTLKTSISQQLYSKVMRFFSKFGLPRQFTNKCKPWYLGMLAQQFQSQEFINLLDLPMDLYVIQLAQKNKIKTVGLETVDDQVSYFEELSPKIQETFLEESVDPKTKKELVQLKNLYVSGNVKKIEDVLIESISKNETKELYEKIYTERNHRMNRAVLPYLNKGNAFIAIGFGHLVTKTGMVKFLKSNGFQVKRKFLTWGKREKSSQKKFHKVNN